MIIDDGHWWSLMIIDDHWWPLMIIDDHWWSLIIIDGYWWLLMIIDDQWWSLMSLDVVVAMCVGPGKKFGCSTNGVWQAAAGAIKKTITARPSARMQPAYFKRTGVTVAARRRHGCSSHARNGTGVTAVARSPEWTQSPKDGVAYTNMFFQSPKIFFDKKISFTIIVCCAWRVALWNCVAHHFQGFSAIVLNNFFNSKFFFNSSKKNEPNAWTRGTFFVFQNFAHSAILESRL